MTLTSLRHEVCVIMANSAKNFERPPQLLIEFNGKNQTEFWQIKLSLPKQQLSSIVTPKQLWIPIASVFVTIQNNETSIRNWSSNEENLIASNFQVIFLLMKTLMCFCVQLSVLSLRVVLT